MPPAVVKDVPTEDSEKRSTRDVERRSDLVCRTKFTNTLPDIPFDEKFVQHPFAQNRFIQYRPTSLERNYKFEVLAEFDLGIPIDLINPDAYLNDGAELSPDDEALLEEDILLPKNAKRSQHHNQSVSWLRRTEYISTEQTRFQPSTMEKVEAKVGFSIKKNFKDETLYMDRESQIKAIEKTFEEATIQVTNHYSKPNVSAVEELSLFPDFKCWKYPCAQVIFDSDPAPVGRPIPAQIEEMSQAMIRGVMDESGEQFVAYFLPTSETLEKRREDVVQDRAYDEDAVYEYLMAREYNWNVKSKTSIGYEENYFFILRSDGIYYNELETRVRLNKRRQIITGQNSSVTKLVVRHRPLDEVEFNMLKLRERAIEDEFIEETEDAAKESDEKSDMSDNEKKSTETDEDNQQLRRDKMKVISEERSDNDSDDVASGSDDDIGNKKTNSDDEDNDEDKQIVENNDEKASEDEPKDGEDEENDQDVANNVNAHEEEEEKRSIDEEFTNSRSGENQNETNNLEVVATPNVVNMDNGVSVGSRNKNNSATSDSSSNSSSSDSDSSSSDSDTSSSDSSSSSSSDENNK